MSQNQNTIHFINKEDKTRTKWGWRQSGRLIVLVFLALDGAVCRAAKHVAMAQPAHSMAEARRFLSSLESEVDGEGVQLQVRQGYCADTSESKE